MRSTKTTAALAPVTADMAPASTIARLSERAQGFASKSRAKRTVDGYRSDWRSWQSWCAAHNARSLPADPVLVAEYVTASASGSAARKAGTIARRLAAISWAHRSRGLTDPTKDTAVTLVWAGIRRTIGTAQEGRAPLVLDELRRLVEKLGTSKLDVRDRALLLLGFAGAFRRSELVGLDREHVTVTSEGLRVRIARSKTDQEGKGHEVGIPYGTNAATCPVAALTRWLETAGITAGPIFRSVDKAGRVGHRRLTAQVVALVVKRRGAAGGLDVSRLSGHSLRRGLATTAALAGVPDRLIQAAGRWSSPAMVTRYTKSANLFAESVARKVGM